MAFNTEEAVCFGRDDRQSEAAGNVMQSAGIGCLFIYFFKEGKK